MKRIIATRSKIAIHSDQILYTTYLAGQNDPVAWQTQLLRLLRAVER
jgi:hypothetical protein